MKRSGIVITSAVALLMLGGCWRQPTNEGDAAGLNSANGGGAGLNADGSGSGVGGHGANAGDLNGAYASLEHRVYFDFNSAIVTSEGQQTLAQNAQWLTSQNAQDITVEGHCDERGTRDYNLALGQKRADAVKDVLVSQGISSSKIHTVSYGKERPLVNEHNESAWSRNRRAEIVVK
ncbi:MAG: peptidoglycan-associated lipoprotein Pal [Magnetococcus sp. DMHC-6]